MLNTQLDYITRCNNPKKITYIIKDINENLTRLEKEENTLPNGVIFQLSNKEKEWINNLRLTFQTYAITKDKKTLAGTIPLLKKEYNNNNYFWR